MQNKTTQMTSLTAVALALGTLASVSSAAIVPVDGPIVSPFESRAEVTFVSRNAGWVGQLSILPSANDLSGAAPQAVMRNDAKKSDPAVDIGTFARGESLFFQYTIITGTPGSYEQNDPTEAKQFRHAWLNDHTARLFVEDIRLPGGDRDYNDAIFDVTFTAVPSPGAVATAALGGLMMIRRRRKA